MCDKDRQGQIDTHSLIQSRSRGGLLEFIEKYRDLIDEHVLGCDDCHEEVMTYTDRLPKLRARMTVDVASSDDPQSDDCYNRIQNLRKLKKGQCLPCGCIVLEAPWTRDMAVAVYVSALSRIAGLDEEEVREIPTERNLLELPLTTIELRRLRDQFYLPDGSYGDPELRDQEEGSEVVGLPETIGEFIDQILSVNSGMSYDSCSDHWDP